MRALRRLLIRLLAGRWGIVLNIDINYHAPGCYVEVHDGRVRPGYMYLENTHFIQVGVGGQSP